MKWFSTQQKTSTATIRSIKPSLERLEDRRVMSVTYHGGPVISHVSIETVYVGQSWQGSSQVQQIDDFFRYITASPFMNVLGQYGAEAGQFIGHDIIPSNLPGGTTIHDSTLRNLINSDIAKGYAPGPDSNTVYFIFTPPDVVVSAAGLGNSKYDFFGYHDAFVGSGGGQVVYAVVSNPVGNGTIAGLNAFQTITSVSSHELAEAVTSPVSGGWYDNATGNEIGDICSDQGTLNGYTVQHIWSNQANACVTPGLSRQDVATAFTHSDEYFANVVEQDYTQLLGRTPSAEEVGGWVAAMDHGLTDENILANFLASPEFYSRQGGQDSAWLDAVYSNVLGRPADAAGKADWMSALQNGADRGSVALQIAKSDEHVSLIVANDYQYYLNRTASEAEIAEWVYAFGHGLTDEQIIASFVASTEYFQAHQSTSAGWLTGVYSDVLGRAPDTAGYNWWLDQMA